MARNLSQLLKSLPLKSDFQSAARDGAVAENSKQKASGLPTLKERMDLLGGTLHIDAQPGQGARMVMEVPAGPRSA